MVVALWGVTGGASVVRIADGPEPARDMVQAVPAGVESSRVAGQLRAAGAEDGVPLVVVWEKAGQVAVPTPGFGALDRERAERSIAMLPSAAGRVQGVTVSKDGQALACVVSVSPHEGVRRGLDAVLRAARQLEGTRVTLAGPAVAQADLDAAFDGLDTRLVAATFGVVLVILVFVYRSFVMPLVVMTSAVLALLLSGSVLAWLTARTGLRVDEQARGILSVLVVGATTDYGLLLWARFQEEWLRGDGRVAALRAAWRASWAPVTASAATVGCALVTLLLCTLPGHRVLAPAGAVAMGCCVLAALTFVPAATLLVQRQTPRPRPRPRSRSRSRSRTLHTLRTRLAPVRVADRRGRVTGLAGLGLLAACAVLAPTLSPHGLPLRQAVPAGSASSQGQAALERHFPGGTGTPAVVLVDRNHKDQVRHRAAATDGVVQVSEASPGSTATGRSVLLATFDSAADSVRAQRTVDRLRLSVSAAAPGLAEVGGLPSQLHDVQTATERDTHRVIPAVLAVTGLLLLLLLRSLVLPLVLVTVAVLNFLAALGVSALVFRMLYGSTATEPSLVLFSFVFLIALGVDYNIFLMHRVREEVLGAADHRQAMLRGLRATGGVISSAGAVLAATFASLTVLPLRYLAQIGLIVSVGVLLETLLVRLFDVPGLVISAGPRLWWPTRPVPAAPSAEQAGPSSGTGDGSSAPLTSPRAG
ncbi:MMPL family transporter [Streptomyces tendae]|uniref:MMPL family transporter n=1 Tax=Streptomyces tendae TaxID=1932 RepID=UPI003722186B